MGNTKKGRIRLLLTVLFMLPAIAFAGGRQDSGAFAGTLVLYTAANEKIEAALIEGFQEKYPEIEIERVNISSGPITARIIAEMNNPRADVIWGLYESYQQALKEKGAIEPYKPKEVDKIDSRFVDPDQFYTGHFVTLMTAGVNTDIMKEKGLPVPKTWEDLAKPIYRGMINIASPAQSGTGMTIMTALHDMFDGWDYIDRLNENIFQYNDSGGAAGRQAARGEIAIGLTYDVAVLSLKNEGFPVVEVFPPNTIYTAECGALIAGANNPELGRLWLDYLCTTDAMERVGTLVSAVTRTDVVLGEEWKPELSKLDLYTFKKTYDLDKFADEWLTRYSR
jgi:iron(III) transport system substrate-binding protein